MILLSFESSQRDESNEYKIMKFQSLDAEISLNVRIKLVPICIRFHKSKRVSTNLVITSTYEIRTGILADCK